MRATLVAALTVLALGAAGCGGSDAPNRTTARGSAAPPRAKILHEPELNRALLTPRQVGSGFVSQRLGWSINANGWPGCLEAVNGITWFSSPTREELASIHPDTRSVFPLVLSTAASFGTEKEAARALPALRAKLAGCKRVTESDGGTRFTLRVTEDERHAGGAVDDQVNISASGLMRQSEASVPLSMRFSAVRVDNNVVLTGFLTVRRAPVTAEADQVTRAALARLAAVVAGAPAPKTSLGFEPYNPDRAPGTTV